METFKKIYKRASERKGGAKALEILLGQKIIGKKYILIMPPYKTLQR